MLSSIPGVYYDLSVKIDSTQAIMTLIDQRPEDVSKEDPQTLIAASRALEQILQEAHDYAVSLSETLESTYL